MSVIHAIDRKEWYSYKEKEDNTFFTTEFPISYPPKTPLACRLRVDDAGPRPVRSGPLVEQPLAKMDMHATETVSF